MRFEDLIHILLIITRNFKQRKTGNPNKKEKIGLSSRSSLISRSNVQLICVKVATLILNFVYKLKRLLFKLHRLNVVIFI